MVLGHDALFALLFLALAGLVVWLRGQPITHRDRVAVLVVVTATTTLWYHRPYDLVLPGVALAALTVKSGVPADRLLFAVFVAAGVFSSGLAGEWRSAWTGLSMKSSWALVSACVPVIILGWLAIARVMSEFSARTSPALEPTG
jgi:hypothetical protein